jgi:hypothetical protein
MPHHPHNRRRAPPGDSALAIPLACPFRDAVYAVTISIVISGVAESIMQTHDRPIAETSLPAWIVAPVLAGLVVAGGLVVLVGWMLMKPAAPVLQAKAPAPSVEVKAADPVEAPPPATDTLIVEDAPDPARPRASFQLPRRRAVDSAGHEPPAVSTEKLQTPEPAPAVEDQPRPKAPIRWMTDNAAPKNRDREVNLILPVEVAKIEDGPLHYSMRRLRYPDGPPKQLRLAVTPYRYDDMANLLTQMGPGYRFTNIKNEDTYSYDKIKDHDVLFLTCSEIFPQDFQSVAPLRKYVEMGGTLYASDLRGDLLMSAFSEFRARSPILPGVPQDIDATIADKGLQTYLDRKTIPLKFEAPGWRPAAFDSAKVSVYLRGVYRNNLGQPFTVPLMVKFRVKRGTVIFTSFHNSRNDSEIVKKVLEFLVFSSINARSEARLKELMQQSQFTPQDLHPLLVSAENPVQAIHKHKGGGLQIALGFENLGAKLKLTLHSPSGRTIEHEDQGLYLIEVPKAEPGPWRYTVTPLEVPYPNFPIVVAVGLMKE